MSYDFKSIEKKWQNQWQHNPPAKTKPVGSGKKYYCLDMFRILLVPGCMWGTGVGMCYRMCMLA